MSANDTTRHSQAFWQTHIKACDEQSISKAKYCRDNELTYHCFIYWYAKYSERVNEHIGEKTTTSKLVPLLVNQSSYPVELQIQLPNGVVISGINDESVVLVSKLIDQL